MTNKRWFLLCVLGLLAASALYRAYCGEVRGNASVTPPAAPPASPGATVSAPPTPTPAAPAPTAPTTHAAAPTPAPAGPVPAVTPPRVDTVHTQAAANPHAPPAALVEFAADLAPRMAAALHAEPAALQLFPELEACALPVEPPAPRTARALCLSNAALLGRTHASLRERYTQLEARMEPDIVQLAR